MKTLIICIHPDLKNSLINKHWLQELSKYPDKYIIHDLYACCPNMNIDILQEQHLLEQYDKIVFQFPFYWFNCPPLLKKWLDEVLTHGWAYGRNSEYKLKDKVIALAVTAGIREEDYQSTGKYQYTLQQLTASFEVTFKYVKALYKPLFAFYGAEYSPSDLEIESSASEYISFIDKL